MGIGPAVAIPIAVKSAGLKLDNIDLFEINEVFIIKFHLLLFYKIFNNLILNNFILGNFELKLHICSFVP